MKIAIIGKGGVGKTTTSGTLARLFAQQGLEVIALDCDANPNLGLSVGLSLAETERLAAIRQALDAAEEEHAPTIPEMLERFGAWATDGVRVAVVSQIDNIDPGCPWCGISAEQLLGEIEAEDTNRVVLADMEAGLGTMTRMAEAHMDYVLVVTEPSWKSIEVAQRAVSLADERQIGQLLVIANRVRNDKDLSLVKKALPNQEILVVPEDAAIREADRMATAPIDAAPNSAGVQAIKAIAHRLLPQAV